MKTIIGIKLTNRTETSTQFQNLLSEYGCIIRTRIGLHDIENGKCSTNGIILLEVINDELVPKFQKDLCSVDGIELQQMVFECN
ncbi:hypothetical protein IJE86_06450 [bacterium]|nr:hypothetical protein [bacterium]